MGITKIKLTVKNPFHKSSGVTGKFLDDSGAHYTVVPKEMVDKLKLTKSSTKDFPLVDG